MKTIVLFILTILCSIPLSAQQFTKFKEKIKPIEHNKEMVYIFLEDKDPIYYAGTGWFIVKDNKGNFREMAKDMRRIFKTITPEDQQILEKISVKYYLNDTFKTDYVEFFFPKECRAYVIEHEDLFYQWIKTFDDMNKYRPYFFREETANGVRYVFPVRTFFKKEMVGDLENE